MRTYHPSLDQHFWQRLLSMTFMQADVCVSSMDFRIVDRSVPIPTPSFLLIGFRITHRKAGSDHGEVWRGSLVLFVHAGIQAMICGRGRSIWGPST
mmetsp:Transcript_138217/g.254268  ORF Transcript_138217/g.254268 Transcript_138217/m.254268 type:complete len:96 (+) Transcript_138217:411-698(+)